MRTLQDTTRVKMRCQECDRVLDELILDDRAMPPRWCGRVLKRRPAGRALRSELPPGLYDALRTARLNPYHCHLRCQRGALVPGTEQRLILLHDDEIAAAAASAAAEGRPAFKV